MLDSAGASLAPAKSDTLPCVIDQNDYKGLPFWEQGMEHTGEAGYIDTFTIGENKLRIIHQASKFDGVVEVNKNGTWCKVLVFDDLANNNDYDRTKDLNRDGYNDLIFQRKWSGDVHFFDPAKGYFSPDVNCEIGEDWHELDSTAAIYYEVNAYNLTRAVISKLFLIKKNARVELADLTLTFDPNDEDYNINKAALHYANSNHTEEIKLPQKASVTSFDYKGFWKEKQKSILVNP